MPDDLHVELNGADEEVVDVKLNAANHIYDGVGVLVAQGVILCDA